MSRFPFCMVQIRNQKLVIVNMINCCKNNMSILFGIKLLLDVRYLLYVNNECSVFAVCTHLPSQTTPASLSCSQLLDPISHCLHSVIDDSCPEHWRLSTQTGPLPSPKWALFGADTALPQPSSRQTTLAPFNPQPLSHTVPHWLLWKNSTLPEQLLLELTSLISPLNTGPDLGWETES